MKETIGEYIHRLRVSQGFTLTQLGALLGVDSGALSKIENGKKGLDKKSLPALAEIFELDYEDLKREFFSELIARDILSNSCDETVLRLAADKVKYLRSKNVAQTQIEF